MALKDNWRGFWSSDVASNRLLDNSGNGHDLIVGGSLVTPGIVTTGGKPDAYRSLNGTSQGNTVASSGGTDFSFGDGVNDYPFGWCAFIYLTAGGGVRGIFSKNNSGNGFTEWDVITDTLNRVQFRVFNPSSSSNVLNITATNAISLSTWYFYAGDYDGSKTPAGLRLFRDGVLETAVTKTMGGTYTGMNNTAIGLKIGCTVSVTTFQNFWQGRLDMTGVRAGMWTDAEITKLYNSGNGLNPFVGSSAMLNFF